MTILHEVFYQIGIIVTDDTGYYICIVSPVDELINAFLL
jgi:hypothetical protein